jgi:hypothetical protein
MERSGTLIEATGPKELVHGPVIDENKLKAVDIRQNQWLGKLFSKKKGAS